MVSPSPRFFSKKLPKIPTEKKTRLSLPLLNELRALRRLRHPNIVLFLAAHVVSGKPSPDHLGCGFFFEVDMFCFCQHSPPLLATFLLNGSGLKTHFQNRKKRHDPPSWKSTYIYIYRGEDPWSLRSDVWAFWALCRFLFQKVMPRKRCGGKLRKRIWKYYYYKVGPYQL